MESKSIPTYKEFLEKFSFENDCTGMEDREFYALVVHEYAVLFAKYHREKTIEAIKEKAWSWGDGTINEESIENAYGEGNIK